MPDDPLAQFRKKSEAPATTAAGTEGDASEYAAFKAVDRRQIRLKVRPSSGPWERVTYSYLLHMPEDEQGTYLALIFTFMTVVVKGRNLQELAEAIGDERCEFIQAYDPKKWKKPKDTSAAFIETIEVETPAGVKETEDTEAA